MRPLQEQQASASDPSYVIPSSGSPTSIHLKSILKGSCCELSFHLVLISLCSEATQDAIPLRPFMQVFRAGLEI